MRFHDIDFTYGVLQDPPVGMGLEASKSNYLAARDSPYPLQLLRNPGCVHLARPSSLINHAQSHQPIKPRLYTYVGPAELKEGSQRGPDCLQVLDAELLKSWLRTFLPRGRTRGEVCTTFIIAPDEGLWIADRRSEHVACADGGKVLAAGEMTFSLSGPRVEAAEITNQSTGYCPEPDCWGIVAAVLDQLGIPRPECFTAEFHFRRCGHCQTITLIKDEVYDCAVCDFPLPALWNLAELS